jgi:hypothetical protein
MPARAAARRPSIEGVHLRRALLLFVIVLGLAALAASLSRSPRHTGRQTTTRAPSPAPAGGGRLAPERRAARPLTVRFQAGRRPERRAIEAGVPASIVVEVPKPGQVVIEGLGLTATAEPLTPARFDVLADRRGERDVQFQPAGSREPRRIGVLDVRGR